MKKIESPQTHNDMEFSATQLKLRAVHDDRDNDENYTKTSITFFYALVDHHNVELTSSEIIMDGDDYTAYIADNEYVWEWAAAKLNLTLVSE
jgi:hypothetical protein